MRRTALFLFSLTFIVFPTLAHAQSQPEQLHKALETKQRIDRRIAQSLPPAATTAQGNHAAGRSHESDAAATAHGTSTSLAGVTKAKADTSRDTWSQLLAGNLRFSSGRTHTRSVVTQREALVGGQHPDAIVLACADSRVSPELLFDQSLGDLFVVRTAGNVSDPIVLGSIEYAVEHLHAQLIVVLGHGSCGAVKAAAANDSLPSPNLIALVEKIRPTVQRLRNCFEGAELIERSVKASAKHTAAEMVTNSKILREGVENGHVRIVSGFYDLTTGIVTPLE